MAVGSLQASGEWSTPDGSMRAAMSQLNLFARAYHPKQSVKLARTIADLVRCEEIQSVQLAEAMQYRPKLIIG
jgi:predicted ATPase with chaperone activity